MNIQNIIATVFFIPIGIIALGAFVSPIPVTKDLIKLLDITSISLN